MRKISTSWAMISMYGIQLHKYEINKKSWKIKGKKNLRVCLALWFKNDFLFFEIPNTVWLLFSKNNF